MEIESVETKLGPEELTRHLQVLSGEVLRGLGLVTVGRWDVGDRLSSDWLHMPPGWMVDNARSFQPRGQIWFIAQEFEAVLSTLMVEVGLGNGQVSSAGKTICDTLTFSEWFRARDDLIGQARTATFSVDLFKKWIQGPRHVVVALENSYNRHHNVWRLVRRNLPDSMDR